MLNNIDSRGGGLRQGTLEVPNQKVLLNFHDAFVGKLMLIDVENLNKLTPLNGASLFGKNKKKRVERY